MFTVKKIDGHTYKVRGGKGALPKDLRGGWNSESKAWQAIDTHIKIVESRLEKIKKDTLERRKRRKRLEDVGS